MSSLILEGQQQQACADTPSRPNIGFGALQRLPNELRDMIWLDCLDNIHALLCVNTSVRDEVKASLQHQLPRATLYVIPINRSLNPTAMGFPIKQESSTQVSMSSPVLTYRQLEAATEARAWPIFGCVQAQLDIVHMVARESWTMAVQVLLQSALGIVTALIGSPDPAVKSGCVLDLDRNAPEEDAAAAKKKQPLLVEAQVFCRAYVTTRFTIKGVPLSFHELLVTLILGSLCDLLKHPAFDAEVDLGDLMESDITGFLQLFDTTYGPGQEADKRGIVMADLDWCLLRAVVYLMKGDLERKRFDNMVVWDEWNLGVVQYPGFHDLANLVPLMPEAPKVAALRLRSASGSDRKFNLPGSS